MVTFFNFFPEISSDLYVLNTGDSDYAKIKVSKFSNFWKKNNFSLYPKFYGFGGFFSEISSDLYVLNIGDSDYAKKIFQNFQILHLNGYNERLTFWKTFFFFFA